MCGAQALVSELKAAQEWLPQSEERLPVDAAVAKANAETRLTADKLAAAEAQCQHLQAVGAANEILLKRLEVPALLRGQAKASASSLNTSVVRMTHCDRDPAEAPRGTCLAEALLEPLLLAQIKCQPDCAHHVFEPESLVPTDAVPLLKALTCRRNLSGA